MKWTKEQQNVIDFRNRDILVSAAAGSGKTAVLVARIIQRILDPQNPVDIDRLLVVTFTKAQQSGMPVSLPRIRLFQRALLPRLPAIRVTHTLAIPERMLIIEKQGFVHATHLPHHPVGQLGSGQFCQSQTALPGNRMGMGSTGNSRFACSGSKPIRPPVRPRSPNDGYLPGIITLHGLDKVRSDCRT